MTTTNGTTVTSKTRRAYEWIRDGITSGRFTPGYRLVLGEIAGELGTSAVPVREAIRLLEAERFVVFEKNIGARVAIIDEAEFVHVMEVLAVIEGFATALGAPNLGADGLTAARAANNEMKLCLSNFDPPRFTELNCRFHALLFESCPNTELLDAVRQAWGRLAGLRSSTFTFVPGRAHESVAEHEVILHLIESGADASTIELAVRRHRLATLDAFREHRAGRA